MTVIRIAFCDDDALILQSIKDLLQEYGAERNREIEYVAFQNPLELMAGIEHGLRPDIILLDVLLPGENGIDIAREIRQQDASVKLIFLTSSAEFAVQSYSVGAFDYYLKPVRKDSFFQMMDKVISQCIQERSNKLVLKVKTGIAAIAPAQLEYCEVMNHTLYLHMNDGQVLASAGSLDNLSGRLDRSSGFLRIHRAYLVNMNYIKHISGRSVTLISGVELPIPHGKFSEIKEAFLEYAFEKDQVLL